MRQRVSDRGCAADPTIEEEGVRCRSLTERSWSRRSATSAGRSRRAGDPRGRTPTRSSSPPASKTDFASVPCVFVWRLRAAGGHQAQPSSTRLALRGSRGYVRPCGCRRTLPSVDARARRAVRRRWLMWAAVRVGAGPRSLVASGLGQLLLVLLVGVPVIVVFARRRGDRRGDGPLLAGRDARIRAAPPVQPQTGEPAPLPVEHRVTCGTNSSSTSAPRREP